MTELQKKFKRGVVFVQDGEKCVSAGLSYCSEHNQYFLYYYDSHKPTPNNVSDLDYSYFADTTIASRGREVTRIGIDNWENLEFLDD